MKFSPSTERTSSSLPAELLKLYISHFLSTWNSRTFEFAAVLFLAAIFPGTLLYASSYALIRALGATLLSSRIGLYVDKTDRLVAIRNSIIWQRIPVAFSCVVFLFLLANPNSVLVFWVCFPLVVILSCIEKLASITNTVSVERDWTVIISESTETPLQNLNSVLRRIDLLCKLVAPVLISFVFSYSNKVAIVVVMVMSSSSSLVEYMAIARVYYAIPHLAKPGLCAIIDELPGPNSAVSSPIIPRNNNLSIMTWVMSALEPWIDYINSPVFLASFSLSLLYLTVLSTGAQFQTYMLSAGYSPISVSLLRVTAVVSELGATCLAPVLMNRIGTIRTGLWSINWQVTWLAMAVIAFVCFDDVPMVAGAGLTAGIVVSRMGLWGFDLSVQSIVQEVESNHLCICLVMKLTNSREHLKQAEGDFQRPKLLFKICLSYSHSHPR
jgi:iron-regulated transporter 1